MTQEQFDLLGKALTTIACELAVLVVFVFALFCIKAFRK